MNLYPRDRSVPPIVQIVIFYHHVNGCTPIRADQTTNVNSVRVRMDFGGSAKFGYLEIRIPFRSPGFSTRCGLGAVGTRFTGMIAE